MKKILSYLSVFLLLFLLFQGCAKESAKIGLSVGPANERWMRDRDFFVSAVNAKGGTVSVKEAKGDEELQSKQIDELIKEGVKVLVIIPENSMKAAAYVRKAHKAGIKVIAYDRMIKNCNLDYYVSFDNVKVGELQADYLTRVRPKGKYVILGGAPSDNNSVLLRLGQMNILQPLIEKGDIEIVYDISIEKWSKETAYNELKSYMQKKPSEIDAIVASSDRLAEGAYELLKEMGLEKNVLLSGQDAELTACQRIAHGEQTMTVYKFLETLANATANIAVSLANEEKVVDPQVTINNGKRLVPSILLSSMIQVHRDNLKLTVVADGYISEDQLYK